MPTAKKAPAKKKASAKTASKKTDTMATVKEGPDLTAAGPIRRVGRPPKVSKPELKFTVHMANEKVELSFDNNRDFERSFKQIALNCAAGRPAVVVSGGKEYYFCSVEYLSRGA